MELFLALFLCLPFHLELVDGKTRNENSLLYQVFVLILNFLCFYFLFVCFCALEILRKDFSNQNTFGPSMSWTVVIGGNGALGKELVSHLKTQKNISNVKFI